MFTQYSVLVVGETTKLVSVEVVLQSTVLEAAAMFNSAESPRQISMVLPNSTVGELLMVTITVSKSIHEPPFNTSTIKMESLVRM